MTDHIYIDGPGLIDMLTLIAHVDDCPHCHAEPAIRLYEPDRYDLVHLHHTRCPDSNYSQRHDTTEAA